MRIAVVSDTHRDSSTLEICKEFIQEFDCVIHLGDNTDDGEYITEDFEGSVYIVKGNCDYGNKWPKDQVIDIDGIRILATHGDMYNVKMGMNSLYYRAREVEANIVLFGHTHVSCLEEYNGLTFMNPGSISMPRNSKGGFIGVIELDNSKIEDIYLEKISQ